MRPTLEMSTIHVVSVMGREGFGRDVTAEQRGRTKRMRFS